MSCLGGSIIFDVRGYRAHPIEYWWYRGDVLLQQSTNSFLRITNVSVADGGVYHVALTNLYGVTNSAPASLTVQEICLAVQLHAGLTMNAETGRVCRIEYANKLQATNVWYFLTNIMVTVPNMLWVDPQPASMGKRFYRALWTE